MAPPLIDGGPPSAEPVPETIAAIDIGTNSVHMVVARVVGNGRFEIITREKEMVRLGQGPGDMKELSDDAIDRGVAALGRCRTIAESFGAELHAVATSAVREAENRDVFLRRAWVEAQVAVDVVSGFEEARLIHLGVLQALPVFDSVILLCDIGGGSTELLYGRGQEVLAARSLKLGAIRLTQRFLDADDYGTTDPDRDPVEECRNFIRDQITPFLRDTRTLRADTMVGSSGTIETLVSMTRSRGGESPRSFNAETITRADVTACVDAIVAAGSLDAVRKLAGVDPSRADILLAGALILDEVMSLFGAEELIFSDAALREGVLLDAVQRHAGAGHHQLSDLRRQSVLHLMEMCEEDPDHAFQVAWIAGRLLETMSDMLSLGAEAAELLDAAAMLANVGLFVSHSRHHQHSYYVIRNSEQLSGFSDREIELIAQVARYHRKSAPSDRHEAFRALPKRDRELVRALAAILRVAIGLDRSHAEVVGTVATEIDDTTVTIVIGPREPDDDLALEQYSATQRRSLLEEVSGRTVSIVIDDRPT